MANPYDGLDADATARALAEVRAQIAPMRQEVAALNSEVGRGKTIRQIEAEGRRGARIGAGATRPPEAEVAAAQKANKLADERIRLEQRYQTLLAQRDKQQGLLARTQSDIRKAQAAEFNAANNAREAPKGSGARMALATEQLQQQTILQKRLLPREAEREKALATTNAELKALEQELAALNSQAGARQRNLAIQREQLLLAKALRLQADPTPLLGSGYSTLRRPLPVVSTGQPFPYGPLPGRPIPQIGGPFNSGFSNPQRQLPPGPPVRPPQPTSSGRFPFGLLPAGDIQKQLPAVTGVTSAVEKLGDAEGRAGGASAGWGSNLQRNQAIMAQSSREMRKFGSLTTEFISAAGRGAVTVRELGYQVTSTIGKFGGWLAAGGAVYAAFGALTAVGKGAIDAQSGVSQLQRVVNNVDTGTAIQQFRDLAGEFNLPIEEVSNAAFEMGKVFDNQNDALEATRAVLASVKVGELDVATSSRYLTSIIQAFNLDASDMAGVFDQVNQAQNVFGIRIEDTLAGLAKSSGTFKAAGGDLSTLLALITTARRATGQTGEVIGTAIARSPNFLRQANNQKELRAFGIEVDPNDITSVYEQAFAKARTLSGAKLQELASALGGPQYGARVFTPLLQQGDLFNKVLADTSPEASKGSAQRELQSVLNQTNEQLAKVVNQLQILGAGLADAGAFDAFGLLLKLLNGILTTTNGIVSVFNEIPDPLKRMVTYMGQFVALLALARRLNIGESLPGAAGRVLTRNNQEAFRYRETLIGQKETLAREAEGSSQAAVRKSIEREAAQAAVTRERQALSTLNATGGTTEAIAAQEERIGVAERQVLTAREAELSAMTKNRAIMVETLAVQTQMADLSRATTNAEARRLAAAYGTVIPGQIGTSAAEAARLAGITGRLPGPTPKPIPSLTSAQSLANQRARALGQYQPFFAYNAEQQALIRQRSQDLTSIMQSTGGAGALTDLPKAGPGTFNPATAGKRFGVLRDNINRMGTFAGTLRTGQKAISDASLRFYTKAQTIDRSSIGSAVKNMDKGLGKLATTLGGFIGPIDAILIAGFVLADQVSRGNEAAEKAEAAVDSLENATSGADITKARSDAAQAAIDDPRTPGRATLGQYRREGDAIDEADKIFNERQEALINLARGEAVGSTTFDSELGTITGQRSLLFKGDYGTQLERVVDRYKGGAEDAKELAQGARALTKEVKLAENLSQREINDMLTKINLAVIDAKGGAATVEDLAAAAGEDLGSSIKDSVGAYSTGFANATQRRDLFRQSLVQAAALINSGNPVAVAQAVEAIDDLSGAINDAAQQELDFSLAFAKGQEERNAAYSKFIEATSPQQIRNQTRKLVEQEQEALQQNQKRQGVLRDQLQAAQKNLTDTFGPGAGRADLEGTPDWFPAGAALEGAQQEVADLRGQIAAAEKTEKGITNRLRGLKQAQKEAIERLRLMRKEQRDARFDENQAIIQARGDLRETRADEGLPALRVSLNTINRLLENAIRHYGRDSKEVLDLLSQQQAAREAIIDEQLALIQAQADYNAAGFAGEGEETQRAQAEIAGLERQLAFMLAHPEQYSAADILGLQAQIREAKAQLAETAQQEAEDLKNAMFDIQAARANARGNDVAAARAELAKALYALRSADSPLEKREARADVINQRANLRQSIFDREIEDIEFQADIGRLTLQEQIRAYQGLLKTLELNRDQRRDLKRRIEQLKNESEADAATFDLDLGSIRLPTVYEIRRAIQGGISNAPNVNMNQTNNFNVTGSNADEIVEKVAQKQGEAARRGANMSRSAGLRG